MFSIFNGKVRGLGDKPKNKVHMRVSVKLREYLHHFKGAKLAVFMAIALHADEGGWSEPTVAQLKRETGYEPATISAAITSLCTTEIDGKRVLMSVVLRKQGKFDRNRYLIFPSPDELVQYADQQRKHRTQKTIDGKTVHKKPSMENLVDGINHKEEEPSIEELNTFFATVNQSQESSEQSSSTIKEESEEPTPVPVAPSLKVAHFAKLAPDELKRLQSGDGYLYIGRENKTCGLKRSEWHNPHIIDKICKDEKCSILDGRLKAIDRYRADLLKNHKLLSKIRELRGKVLVCWCHPQKCHGEVLTELASLPDDELDKIIEAAKPERKKVELNHFEKMIAVIVLGFRTDQTMQANIPIIRKFQRLGLTNEGYEESQMPTPEQAQVLGDDLRDKWQHWYRGKCKDCDMPSGKDGGSFSKWYGQWVDAGKPKDANHESTSSDQPDRVPHPEIPGAFMSRSQYRQWEQYQQSQKERQANGKQSS